MKRVFSVIVVILSLLMVFQQGIMMLCFKLNQEAIEKRFCINISKPALQCHGRCHLKQKMRDSESNNSTAPKVQKVDLLFVAVPLFDAESPVVELSGLRYIFKAIYYEEPAQEPSWPPPWAV